MKINTGCDKINCPNWSDQYDNCCALTEMKGMEKIKMPEIQHELQKLYRKYEWSEMFVYKAQLLAEEYAEKYHRNKLIELHNK